MFSPNERRYIIALYHPSNAILRSPLLQRWALLGFILSMPLPPATLAISRMALFLDFLAYGRGGCVFFNFYYHFFFFFFFTVPLIFILFFYFFLFIFLFLYPHSRKGNIMDVEPGLLLMVKSMGKYQHMTGNVAIYGSYMRI
jgi:hypothetical protein